MYGQTPRSTVPQPPSLQGLTFTKLLRNRTSGRPAVDTMAEYDKIYRASTTAPVNIAVIKYVSCQWFHNYPSTRDIIQFKSLLIIPQILG